MPTSSPKLETTSKYISRKRQRSGDPRDQDWHTCHADGPPAEVNAIGDSYLEPSVPVVSNIGSSRSALDKETRHAVKMRTVIPLLLVEEKKTNLEGSGESIPNRKPRSRLPVKAPEVQVRQISDTSSEGDTKVDDDDGHYLVVPNTDLTERYRVTQILGQGQYSKVVQAIDRETQKEVAIKIIKSVQKYRDASLIELRVLATLKANDNDNCNRCIHFEDCFEYRKHICIVMELLGQSVYDFLKENLFKPFPKHQIQSFASQSFTSVAFIHNLNLVHTDLKPENIVLCDSSSRESDHTESRVLLNTEIRLINFGSAVFEEKKRTFLVSTCHFRAPEIIFGQEWSFPCDIWSIGCILIELFTGKALFETQNCSKHLAKIEAFCGTRFHKRLTQKINPSARRLFKHERQRETSAESRLAGKSIKPLKEILSDNDKFCTDLLDLCRQIFVFDPARRLTAKQALRHPLLR